MGHAGGTLMAAPMHLPVDGIRDLDDEALFALWAREVGDTPWEDMTPRQSEIHIERKRRRASAHFAGGASRSVIVQSNVLPAERAFAAHILSRAWAYLGWSVDDVYSHYRTVLPNDLLLTHEQILECVDGRRFPEEHMIVSAERAMRHTAEKICGRKIEPDESYPFARPRPPRHISRLLAGLSLLRMTATARKAFWVFLTDGKDDLSLSGAWVPQLAALFPEVDVSVKGVAGRIR
ncbi:MAG: hypothetical protein JWM41_2181 [Gemmatimonadetes bacterium]|nr:hypothetical protein [Gemmatimonadota bacterium]